tara:strand:- start:1404 stop:1577 length:174 start_codon:yes stop_codon:yes gene_type:complete
MCLICIEILKEKMTSYEARRALAEFGEALDEEHKIELLKAIWKKEDQEIKKREEDED